MNIEKRILEIYEEINKSKQSLLEVTDVYNNVDFKDNVVGVSTPSKDNINTALLTDIQTAAKNAGVTVDVTTAISGHSAGKTRHTSGNAVDISIINDKPVSITNRGDADRFVDQLVKLGYVKNKEVGNDKSVLTFGFAEHNNHVHVSNLSPTPSTQAASGTTQQTDKDDIFGIKQLDPDDIMVKKAREMAGQLGLKEEKIYGNFGERTSDRFGSLIIPSRNNSKIKSPIDGIVYGGHSDPSCKNQVVVQHEIEGKKYFLQFCNITTPNVKDGKTISKGTILGKTSDDVKVSLFDIGWGKKDLISMMNKEIKEKIKSKKEKEKDDKKEIKYYDPAIPYFLKKIHDLIPSISKNKKGEEPKIANFFSKHSLSNKKVNENIEKIKKLL